MQLTKSSTTNNLISKHTEVRQENIITWDITVTYATIPFDYQNAYMFLRSGVWRGFSYSMIFFSVSFLVGIE